MKKNKQKIFIVDDHPIVRLGLHQIICLENNLECSGEASSANEAITKISNENPDLVIVDISLDGDMSGFDLIQAIHDRFDGIKTLVLSMFEESFYVDKALRAGARGYIAKKYAYNTIIEAIYKVLAGEIFLSSTTSQTLLQNMYKAPSADATSAAEQLSKREHEIFLMIGNGFDTDFIAVKLGLSANTVQTYKRHIKEKLGLKNHNDLIRKATLFIQMNQPSLHDPACHVGIGNAVLK
jgi:DNA-binding NarL/FixJ family response regulator